MLARWKGPLRMYRMSLLQPPVVFNVFIYKPLFIVSTANYWITSIANVYAHRDNSFRCFLYLAMFI
jgi:hypothetical protein